MPPFNFSMDNPGKTVREAATILVQGFGELFNHAKLDVQWWKEYFVSVHQRIVDDVIGSTRHSFISCWQVLLGIVLRSVPTIPHAQKARVLGKSRLLSNRKFTILRSTHISHSC